MIYESRGNRGRHYLWRYWLNLGVRSRKSVHWKVKNTKQNNALFVIQTGNKSKWYKRLTCDKIPLTSIHCLFFSFYFFTLFWTALLTNPQNTVLQDTFFDAIMAADRPVGQAYDYLMKTNPVLPPKTVLIKTLDFRKIFVVLTTFKRHLKFRYFFTEKRDRWTVGGDARISHTANPRIHHLAVAALSVKAVNF